jgi:hypothetical protein
MLPERDRASKGFQKRKTECPTQGFGYLLKYLKRLITPFFYNGNAAGAPVARHINRIQFTPAKSKIMPFRKRTMKKTLAIYAVSKTMNDIYSIKGMELRARSNGETDFPA